MIDFQLRHATQHDFATIIRFVQAMLSEMESLSNRELADRAEAWLDFERRILQTLSRDENGNPMYPCAADHLVEIAEMMGDTSPGAGLPGGNRSSGADSPIGLIEASFMHPLPSFRPLQTLYIHALYVLPQCRCQGAGTALLRAALNWGQQHHCLQAELCALPHNPARRLYQELGFKVYGLEMRKEMTSVS